MKINHYPPLYEGEYIMDEDGDILMIKSISSHKYGGVRVILVKDNSKQAIRNDWTLSAEEIYEDCVRHISGSFDED